MASLSGVTTPEEDKKIKAVTIVTPGEELTPPGKVPETGTPTTSAQFESAVEEGEETPVTPTLKTPPGDTKDPRGKFDVGPDFFYQKSPVHPNTNKLVMHHILRNLLQEDHNEGPYASAFENGGYDDPRQLTLMDPAELVTNRTPSGEYLLQAVPLTQVAIQSLWNLIAFLE